MNFQEEIQKLKELIQKREFQKEFDIIMQTLEKEEPAPENKEALLAELQKVKEAREAFVVEQDAANEVIFNEVKTEAEALLTVPKDESFFEKAKALQAKLHAAKSMQYDKKNELRALLEQGWKAYNDAKEERKRISEEKQRVCMQELLGIDISAPPAPSDFSFETKKSYSEQIRFAREKLKQIGQMLKTDPAILPAEKRDVFERMDKIRNKAKLLEEAVFGSFSARAEELYQIAKNAIDTMSVNRAIEPFKEAQRELNILWISKEDRDKYKALFEEMYQFIRGKREENKTKHREWMDKQKQGMDRLVQARDKAMDALKRVQTNLEDNRKRLEGSQSEEFTLRVEAWIRDGEEKEKDILSSVNELEKKIRDIQRNLK